MGPEGQVYNSAMIRVQENLRQALAEVLEALEIGRAHV